MPLHLLKHKSYHVGSARNIARVRRDEEEHARKQAEADRDAVARESAARVAELREKRGLPAAVPDDEPAPSDAARGHVNLFQPEEDAANERLQGAVQRATERRKDKGPAAHAGATFAEQTAAALSPWYAGGDPKDGQESAKRQRRIAADKKASDPLTEMERLEARRSRKSERPRSQHRRSGSEDKGKRKGPKSIEDLRRDRLAREQAESRRARELLRSKGLL